MIVEELRRTLKLYPQDAKVVITTHVGGVFIDVHDVNSVKVGGESKSVVVIRHKNA